MSEYLSVAELQEKYGGGSSPAQASSGGSSSGGLTPTAINALDKAKIAPQQQNIDSINKAQIDGAKRTEQIKTGLAVAQMNKDQVDGYYRTLTQKGLLSSSEKDAITGSANKSSGYTYRDIEKTLADKVLESLGILKDNSGSNIEMSNAAKSAWDTLKTAKAAYNTARTDGSDSATLRAARDAMKNAEQDYYSLKRADTENYYERLKYNEDFSSKAYEGQRDYGDQITAIDGSVRNTGNKINYAIANKDKILATDLVSEGGKNGLDEYRNLWYITDEERQIYNYLYRTQGSNAADEYLKFIKPLLNERAGQEKSGKIANMTGAKRFTNELVAAGAAGLSSALGGLEQNMYRDARPQSEYQAAFGGVQRDIAKRKGDGFNLERIAVDTVNTISNMAPAMALGSVNPAIGAAAIGLSSRGNTYQSLLNQGYTRSQANEVATVLGIAEGGLSYVLGGISNLGGKLTGVTAEKLTEGMTSAVAKAVTTLGIDITGENVEEYIQNKLETVLRNNVLGENNELKLFDKDDLYTALLTTLTTGLINAPKTVQTAFGARPDVDTATDTTARTVEQNAPAAIVPTAADRKTVSALINNGRINNTTATYIVTNPTMAAAFEEVTGNSLTGTTEEKRQIVRNEVRNRSAARGQSEAAVQAYADYMRENQEPAQESVETVLERQDNAVLAEQQAAVTAQAESTVNLIRNYIENGTSVSEAKEILDNPELKSLWQTASGIALPESRNRSVDIIRTGGNTVSNEAAFDAYISNAISAEQNVPATQEQPATAANDALKQPVKNQQPTAPASGVGLLMGTDKIENAPADIKTGVTAESGITGTAEGVSEGLSSDNIISSDIPNVNTGNGATVERGYSENIRTDTGMNDAVREEFESDPEYYTQKTNKETLDKASAIFEQGIDKAESTLRQALADSQVNNKKFPPEMVPLSRMVANELARNGRVDSAREILSGVAAELTEAGQLGQAARILRNADPVTKSDTIRKMVEKLNKNLKANQLRKNVKNGIGDEAGKISVDEQLLTAFETATTDEEQNTVLNQIEQNIAEQIPATFRDKFTALRYLNMLGNFKTQGRNIVGNTAMALATVAKRRVQATNELVASIFNSGLERNSSLRVGGGMYKEARADFDNVKDVAMGEAKYSDAGAQYSKNIQDKRKIFSSKLLEGYRNLTNKSMEIGDEIFIRFHYADALGGWMQAHGINSLAEATPEQLAAGREYAIKEAQEATFRDSNAVADFITTFDKGWGKNLPGRIVQAGLQGVMPFRKTPANVAIRAVEYSPVGVAETVIKGIQAAKGNATGADVINSLSKNVTGSALAIAGYLLAQAGRARGSEDDDELDAFEKLQGAQDYSINVNGQNISLSQFAPMAVPFFMGVKLQETLDGENFSMQTITDILACITEPMLEMSMLGGINDALNDLSDANGESLLVMAGNSMLNFLTQGISNTLLGQLEQISDKNRQTHYSDPDNFLTSNMQYKLGKYLDKVPFVDYNQQDYVDAWGRTQSNGGLGERIINALLNPTYGSEDKSSAVDKELQRLYEDNKDKVGFPNVFPQKGSRGVDYGDGKTMTPEEYMQYSKDRGQKSLELVSQFMDSDEYKMLNDDQRADVISKLYSLAADRALKTVQTNNGVKYKGDWDDEAELSDIPQYLADKEILSSFSGKDPDYGQIDSLIQNYGLLPDDLKDKLGGISNVNSLLFANDNFGIGSKEFANIKNMTDEARKNDFDGSSSDVYDALAISKSYEGTDEEKLKALETVSMPSKESGKRSSIVRRYEAAMGQGLSFDYWSKLEAKVQDLKTGTNPSKQNIYDAVNAITPKDKYGNKLYQVTPYMAYRIYKKYSDDESKVDVTNDYFSQDYIPKAKNSAYEWLMGETGS